MTLPTIASEERLLFANEPTETEQKPSDSGVWNILIVDDEPDVHQVTMLSLRSVRILGRELALHHAYSGAQAEQLLKTRQHFAVILLDVVMESDDTGLKLVEFIRRTLKNDEIRIILRTGQPGMAPESKAVANYDINDYRAKTELTRTHLITSLTSALRSFQQIVTLNNTQRDMAKIVGTANLLMHTGPLSSFGMQMIKQVRSLLNIEVPAALCWKDLEPSIQEWHVLAADEYFQCLEGSIIDVQHPLFDRLSQAVDCEQWFDNQLQTSLTIGYTQERQFVLIMDKNFRPEWHHVETLRLMLLTLTSSLENQLLLENLKTQAWEDSLCGIPNRARLMTILASTVHSSVNYDLYLLDIDEFSNINSGLGQEVGDHVLIQLSHRLNSLITNTGMIFRISGDTFAILAPRNYLSADKLFELFESPIQVADSDLRISVSIGKLADLSQCNSPSDAMRKATMALSQAKAFQRGELVTYADHLDEIVSARLKLLNKLKNAIHNNELCLYYQPKVSLVNGRTDGLEALMRWPTDDGFIPPQDFISVAESSGLIFELERFLIRQTCRDLKEIEKICPDTVIAINVSVPVVESEDFFEYVKDTLKEYNVRPEQLMIELTESIMIRNHKLINKRLNQYRNFGIQFSIDDFGTGYNSLTYLHNLPIAQIKIDKSFIDNMTQSNNGTFLSSVIISIANHFNFESVAEGVETAEQVAALKHIGCNYAQGYYFCKPCSLEDICAWMHQANHP
ncbi:bifunctional diguanylate cyclase/phosphodiesterase [Gynuella sunshinyii]|uniref:Putative signal transduction protein containing a membrane domain, an EAL and a GGDEF domain n=1 Tax=Gynuella sunshinyii YC6258 TaxID=1445510 RepID=A0A0C5VFZ9_9GAMM|nr:EAL domain-containing protein [Gynuella sunshinyii]AJQ93121.1 putative signal transduction protein containing a membrane domain, an EAL and a GGDEF domain [Gynuella sunshinyii YC6258]